MKPIVSPKTMAMLDQRVIEQGTSSRELMLRAAGAISKHLASYKKILIVTGPGNNGGDGLALATLLLEQGKKVCIFLASEPKSKDAIYFYQQLKESGFNSFVDEISCQYDVIVDCIFGNGLNRELSSRYKSLINVINNCKVTKISVDIPTGINGTNGMVMGNAIKSSITIVIASYKYGHFLQDAKDYVGTMVVEDIDIPIDVVDAYLIEEKDIKKVFPIRKQNSNKYTFGRVCIIGGSSKYKGAPILSMLSNASLRVGAGLGYIAYPKSIEGAITAHSIEEIHIPLKNKGGLIVFDKKALDKIISTSDVIAFGMGIGRSHEIEKTLKYLLEHFDGTLIIDADGLTAYFSVYKHSNIISKVILTPHLGEAVRLFEELKDSILLNRVDITKDFAKKNNVVVLLKGPCTIVSDGDIVYFVPMGSVAQAKAGSGDILSGVIAGIEAYNRDSISSAYAGTYVVGKAAKLAEEELGQYGVLASDLPKIIKSLNQ